MRPGTSAALSFPPQPAAPRAGRRLSFRRVLGALVTLAAVVAVVTFGFRIFVVDTAREASTAPWFAGYVDATLTPQYAFEAPETDANGNIVLSFIVASAADDCTPSWGAAYTLDSAAQSLDIDRRIARLQQLNGDTIVSFGGAINTELASACSNVDDLTDAYRAVVDRYELSTIDFDIEVENLSDTIAGERRAAAVAALQTEQREEGKDLAIWLTLPTMPTGLTSEGTHLVGQMLAAGVDVAGVNIMTMDYGIDLGGKAMGELAIDALTAVHSQLDQEYTAVGSTLTTATLWAKLGATPMIGQNDVPAEVFTLDDARELNTFAQDKQLGRLSAWSLNRDRTCGANYRDLTTVSNLCSGVDQGEETFTEVLSAKLDGSPSASSAIITVAEPTANPTSTAVAQPGRELEADDPATSPYPIWAEGTTYLAGTKLVWHSTVYEAKWWTLGDVPDDPLVGADVTPWILIGPVLAGETPYIVPTLPTGTYPEWSGHDVYEVGARVLFDNVPYEAKWWTQGDSPAAIEHDSDGSPWLALTAAQVAVIAAAVPTTAPTP